MMMHAISPAFHDRSGARLRRGLTLIEMMIVVAIVAVVAGLASPSFVEMMARNRVSGAGGEAVIDLQYARTEAVQRNAPVTVTFSATGYQVMSAGTVLKSVTLSDSNYVSAGADAVVTFEPVRATASVVGGPTITVANPKTARTLRLGVNLLGRPEICTPSGDLSGYTAC